MVEDALERAAYERDPTLFWLWPERWERTLIDTASQRHKPFWRFIPRVKDWIRLKPSPQPWEPWLGFHGSGDVTIRLIDRYVNHLADFRGRNINGGWGLLNG